MPEVPEVYTGVLADWLGYQYDLWVAQNALIKPTSSSVVGSNTDIKNAVTSIANSQAAMVAAYNELDAPDQDGFAALLIAIWRS